MDNRKVIFKDLGIIEYKTAWDYQEELLQKNVAVKSALRKAQELTVVGDGQRITDNCQLQTPHSKLPTQNYFLFCEHPAVYTLGKSGNANNVLMSDAELEENNIQFFNTNRGGDITFHGLQQVVGYPILDLENF